MLLRALLLCSLAAGASPAQAARLELPLRLPTEAIRAALAAHLAAASRGTDALYREGRCRSLSLGAPALTALEGRLRVSAPGSATLGLELLGRCHNAAAWRGTLQLTLEPRLDAAGRLRLRVVDSALADESGSPAAGRVREMSKRYVHARLERFAYDLAPAREALLALVRGAAPAPYRAALQEVLATIALRPPRVGAAEVIVPLAIEFPDAWLAGPPPGAAAAPLGEAELAALERALEPWDAFLVYSLKQLARDVPDASLRARLFTLLLDSRYRLNAILSGEAPAGGDPLQALFAHAWQELRGIIGDAERAGLLNGSLLRYAAFVDAGDALLALERAAPGLRLRPSADGLRRLARSLRPLPGGDPLAYDWSVDAELAALFGVPPLPAAQPPEKRSWLDWAVRPAHAARPRPLDPWVPKRDELDEYAQRVAALLRESSAAELRRAKLAPRYETMYRHLLPATALIESCWRQYVLRRGKVTYLRSAARSVGMMQVNQRVWRGFYDVQRLRWDTAYNVRAGAQILLRYLADYAIPYAARAGDPAAAARAAYAAYNAGPRAVGRFAKARPHPREKRVDDRFRTLYRGFAAGARAELRTCSVAETPAPQ